VLHCVQDARWRGIWAGRRRGGGAAARAAQRRARRPPPAGAAARAAAPPDAPLASLFSPQSLLAGDEFQHILRVLNTNVDGKQKVMYAMTAIRGIGRRFSNLVCKKAEVDMRKR
jgi:hypothetical protein